MLTWDARGFGGSGGQVEIDSAQFEGRDVQALIDYVAAQPEALLDSPGDPRLGMNGVSYGGGIQLVTAAIDDRVDAITPTIAWNSLLTSLYKEQVVKQGWGSILTGAGGTAVAGGLFGPAGPQTGGLNPAINNAFVEGAATGRFSDASVEFFRSRVPAGELIERVRVPTLLIQGTADTLLTPQEAAANHAVLKRNGVPVRMVWFCGGHGICLDPRSEGRGVVERSMLSWLTRWLLEDPSVETGAPFTAETQDGALRDGQTFPPVATGSALTASGSGTGSTPTTHVYGQLVDVATGRVVGNQSVPIPVTLDGAEHVIERPLEPISFHAQPGARLRFQLAPASSLYATQRTAGVLNLSRVDVSIPGVDLSAAPRDEALRIGSAPGMRRARRGRPFQLRVRPTGTALRDAAVIVRDRRGRRVGTGTVGRVGLRGAAVSVRVRRPIRVGSRYRFAAAGRTAEGRALDAARGVRVRGVQRRLKIGFAQAMRRGRPGRPVRVRVRPVRVRMRATRVVLRDARGRVVGRSRRVRIGTRGRAVRVPVRRAVRAGARYRFGASGRAVDGRRLSATRRVRVRAPRTNAAAAALTVFGAAR